jgi:hypothetical protein
VEEGDFTLGPMTSFALVAFDALTITSPAGTVTGSKTLAPDVAPVNTGACGPFSGFVPNAPDSFNLQVPTRYTATQPGGASDSGEAIVSYGDMQFRDLPDTNTSTSSRHLPPTPSSGHSARKRPEAERSRRTSPSGSRPCARA